MCIHARTLTHIHPHMHAYTHINTHTHSTTVHSLHLQDCSRSLTAIAKMVPKCELLGCTLKPDLVTAKNPNNNRKQNLLANWWFSTLTYFIWGDGCIIFTGRNANAWNACCVTAQHPKLTAPWERLPVVKIASTECSWLSGKLFLVWFSFESSCSLYKLDSGGL